MSSLLNKLDERTERIGAVVLAGGLARRMGGTDKGLVNVAGSSMVEHVLNALKSHVHTIVINANRNTDAYEAFGVAVVADKHAGHLGPLAGLSAGIEALQTDYVFMCPCDSPFIDGAIVEKLGDACLHDKIEVAVATDGHRMQPVFCVVRRAVLPSLNAYLHAGDRKIDLWYASRNCIEVDCSEFTDSFRNINTEEERIQAEQALML